MTLDSMMQTRLQDYVGRREGVCLATDQQGDAVLVCDEYIVVNFIAQPDQNLLSLLAQAGRIDWPASRDPGPAPTDDEWTATSHSHNGFEWSTAWQKTSGAFVVMASITSPDAIEFEQWLDRFVARLRISARALSSAPDQAARSLALP